ncbi:MAG: AAA family ATPase [Planctomycetota bacterium]|nr:AAA family ATPase [Planctomycetota bacterium]
MFGNSGAGKSTLAKRLKETESLAHLDLDSIAWLPTSPPQRSAEADAQKSIQTFVDENENWVIEGCYGDLLQFASQFSSELVFLDLSVEDCTENARNRPWEKHKYESKEAQDANFEMLVNWIGQYDQRADCFSQSAHTKLYESYKGKKSRLRTRKEINELK